MNNDIQYEKKIELCEKLGALQFQKIVFGLEKIKFKVIKKLFPNYIEMLDKIYDKKRDKQLEKLNPEDNRLGVINYYRTQKFLARKEFYEEKNRNYHMDKINPVEFINYLNWNKKVHVNGIKKNVIIILISSVLIPLFPMISIVTICELISLVINFECVNLQNYNINRFYQKEEKLKKIHEYQNSKIIKKYDQCIEIISDELTKTQEIPTVENITSRITTREQLEQMKALINSQLQQRVYQEENTKKR